MLEKIMNLHVLFYCMAALGAMGAIGMFATHLTYRRVLKKAGDTDNLKEKWLNLWKTRDRLLHRMNRFVWYPSLLCTACMATAVLISMRLPMLDGVPLRYLYLGAAAPLALTLLRQGLDFSYQEELIMSTLADYVEKVRDWVEEEPAAKEMAPAIQEEVVERITQSIRQTAASGSHFSKMLSPEEEELMREIIREFMT